MSNVLGRQALVIGAGMSGLAAAGALAKYFEQVTVVERDGLADDRPTARARLIPASCTGSCPAAWRPFAGSSPASIGTWRRPALRRSGKPSTSAKNILASILFPAATSAGFSTARPGRCSSTRSDGARAPFATS